jgi:hypothetical protein
MVAVPPATSNRFASEGCFSSRNQRLLSDGVLLRWQAPGSGSKYHRDVVNPRHFDASALTVHLRQTGRNARAAQLID